MRKKLVQAKDVQGRDKPFWLNIGSVFLKDDGSIKGIKLDVLPLPNGEGEIWLRVFDIEDDRSGSSFSSLSTEEILNGQPY